MYSRARCRCADCTAANRDYARAYYQAYRRLGHRKKVAGQEAYLYREPSERLSAREMEVLRVSCEAGNKGRKEVVARLGISRYTVRNHHTNIFRKLGVYDTTQMAVLAWLRGCVE